MHGGVKVGDDDPKPVLAAIASRIAEASDVSWEVAVFEALDQEILASLKTAEKIASNQQSCLQWFS